MGIDESTKREDLSFFGCRKKYDLARSKDWYAPAEIDYIANQIPDDPMKWLGYEK